MGADDTTDKVFPPPENPNPDAPIPIGPSLRVIWKRHQRDIEDRFQRFETLLAARGALSDEPSPKSAAKRVLKGAGIGGQVVLYVSGGLGILAMLARLFGRNDVAGPLEQLQQLFGQ